MPYIIAVSNDTYQYVEDSSLYTRAFNVSLLPEFFRIFDKLSIPEFWADKDGKNRKKSNSMERVDLGNG